MTPLGSEGVTHVEGGRLRCGVVTGVVRGGNVIPGGKNVATFSRASRGRRKPLGKLGIGCAPTCKEENKTTAISDQVEITGSGEMEPGKETTQKDEKSPMPNQRLFPSKNILPVSLCLQIWQEMLMFIQRMS